MNIATLMLFAQIAAAPPTAAIRINQLGYLPDAPKVAVFCSTALIDLRDFQVIDAKTGDDLTRAILLQIILDEEGGGVPMFSSEMLALMIRFYGSAQQTIMGTYMEQNVKAFLAIQKKLQDQAKQVYGDKMLLTPDLWKQFMQMQAPAMQGMLGNYLEQSAKLFMDMQQRMQDQTRGMFSAFPFPAFTATPQGGADDEKKR